jgi:hypothetical protein
MSFIRPAIRPKRTQYLEPQILSAEGDGILAIIKRKMDSPIIPRENIAPSSLYVPNQDYKYKSIKEHVTLNPVNVRLVVTETGVKVKLDTLSWDLYTEYFSKAKKPPLGPYLRSLVKSGASDAQLEKVIKSYKMWEDPKFLGELDDYIQLKWPGNSRLSKTKQPINTKKILKAVKKL